MITVTFSGYTTTAPITEPGDYLFRWVPDEHIPKAHRALVDHLVKRTAKRHGFPPITVRYYLPLRGGGSMTPADIFTRTIKPLWDGEDRVAHAGNGAFTPATIPWTICLDAGMRGAAAVRCIVLHEIGHCAHLWGGVDVPGGTREAFEAYADRFALRHMGLR